MTIYSHRMVAYDPEDPINFQYDRPPEEKRSGKMRCEECWEVVPKTMSRDKVNFPMSYFEHRSSVLEDRWGHPQGWYGHQDQCRKEANRKLILVFSVKGFIWPSSNLGAHMRSDGDEVEPYGVRDAAGVWHYRRDIDRGLLARTSNPWDSPGGYWVDNFDGEAEAVGLAARIHDFKRSGGDLTYEALYDLTETEDVDFHRAYDRLHLEKEGGDWLRILDDLTT